MREHLFRFAGFWIFQLLWVWIVSFPISFSNSCDNTIPINGGDIVGCIIAGLGLIIEVIADQSKFNFKYKSI